jgi:hypothetical protein
LRLARNGATGPYYKGMTMTEYGHQPTTWARMLAISCSLPDDYLSISEKKLFFLETSAFACSGEDWQTTCTSSRRISKKS